MTVPPAAEAAATALSAAYSHGPGKSLWVPPQPPALRAPHPARGVPLTDLARATALGPGLAQALTLALAPRRWEPWNAHNDHRAYPSPRSLNLTDAAVRMGRGRWLVDPVRLTAHADRDASAPTVPSDAAPVTVELSANPDRLPAGYGTLREAAAILEAGHVSAALVEAACAVGLRPAARAALADGPTNTSGQLVARVHLAAAPAASWPRRRVQAHRSSGLGAHGRLTADPRPLPAPVWAAFLQACATVPAGSLAGQPPADRLRHRLAVGHVEGVADGLYELRAGRLARYGAPARGELQDAFRFGPEVVDVAGMNIVWVMTASLAAIVADGGAAGYPRTLLAAGAVAQHVCSAAADSGLFCRPVRSMEEPATEAAVGAPAAEDAVYMLLIGRPRVLDFSYDLTDPQEQP
jgi:hypothetical protein